MSITPHFSTSGSFNYGRSNSGVHVTTSFIQGNLNIFYSPFKNNQKNDFRIGLGFSAMNVSDAMLESEEYTNGVLIDQDYRFEVRSDFGYNFILEDTYKIKQKYQIGIKLFTQSYFEGDIITGALLKIGIEF